MFVPSFVRLYTPSYPAGQALYGAPMPLPPTHVQLVPFHFQTRASVVAVVPVPTYSTPPITVMLSTSSAVLTAHPELMPSPPIFVQLVQPLEVSQLQTSPSPV